MTTGQTGWGVSAAIQVQRHAQALRECHALASGTSPAADGALASVGRQQEVVAFAHAIRAGGRQECDLIADDIMLTVRSGGSGDTTISKLRQKAKQYGCLR